MDLEVLFWYPFCVPFLAPLSSFQTFQQPAFGVSLATCLFCFLSFFLCWILRWVEPVDGLCLHSHYRNTQTHAHPHHHLLVLGSGTNVLIMLIPSYIKKTNSNNLPRKSTSELNLVLLQRRCLTILMAVFKLFANFVVPCSCFVARTWATSLSIYGLNLNWHITRDIRIMIYEIPMSNQVATMASCEELLESVRCSAYIYIYRIFGRY